MQQTEVMQLRQRIAEEYEAMKLGLQGLSLGTAKHAFIDARMKRVDQYHNQLVEHVGEQEAAVTVYELYLRMMD